MKTEIRSVLFDTSALIELFSGTKMGEEVKKFFEYEQLYVPSIVLTEFISKLKRNGADPYRYVTEIENACVILELTTEVAKKAGDLHAELKSKEKFISIMDCIIMAHGFKENIPIVTKDQHFKHYPLVTLLIDK